MTRTTTPAEGRLVGLLARAARGPERDGLFALWLMLRAAEALFPPHPVSLKNHRRRLQALETRLGSLALPAPLKRALECRPCSSTGAARCPMGHHRCLADITPAEVAVAVQRLVA